jgi:hypothetical protein
MKEISFHGCSDYVEHFWNAIAGEWIPGKVYLHLVTHQDAVDYATLREGMTVHMMASKVSAKWERYIISVAVTDDIDDTELEAKVAELRAAGALHVESDYHSTSVITYEKLLSSWGRCGFTDDPRWNEITRLDQTQTYKEYLREVNKYFVANARVFTKEELVIIDGYKAAEAAYYGIMRVE